MTCSTCKHSIHEAVKESDLVWRVHLICCENIDNVRVVKNNDTCKFYEREPGCDEQGRGDSGNWN